MNKLQIIILCLSVLDLAATYLYISSFHAKFPTLDYTQLEANPLIKMAMKQWGIKVGMLVGGLLVFLILTLVVLNLKSDWQFYLAGVLSMMLIYHVLNFTQLAALKPA